MGYDKTRVAEETIEITLVILTGIIAVVCMVITWFLVKKNEFKKILFYIFCNLTLIGKYTDSLIVKLGVVVECILLLSAKAGEKQNEVILFFKTLPNFTYLCCGCAH